MKYTKAGATDIPALRALWKEVFSDSDTFTETFFTCVFPTCEAFCAREGDEITAMLYALPQTLCDDEKDEKAAYLYAIATKEAYRGQGICRKLVEFAHKNLKKQYFSCIYLACETEELAEYYRSLGFSGKEMTAKTVTLPKPDGEAAVISAIDYAGLRETLLFDLAHIRYPKSVFDLLDADVTFYRLQTKNSFGCACTENCGGKLKILECLPDSRVLPALAAALGQTEAETADGQPQFLFLSEKEPPYCAFSLD